MYILTSAVNLGKLRRSKEEDVDYTDTHCESCILPVLKIHTVSMDHSVEVYIIYRTAFFFMLAHRGGSSIGTTCMHGVKGESVDLMLTIYSIIRSWRI